MLRTLNENCDHNNSRLPHRATLFANFFLVIATVIWGSTFFLIHDNLHDINAVTLTAYRFLLSALFLGVYLLCVGKNILAHLSSGLLLGVLLAIFYLTQTLGLVYTRASSSGFITSLVLIFIPIFNFVLWRKLPSLWQLIAIAVSLIGVWLIASFSGELNQGDLLTLGSACVGGLQIIVIDKCMQKNMDLWILNFQQFLVAGVISLICVVIFHAPLHVHTLKVFLSVIYLAIAANVVAYGLLFIAQKHISPVNTALLLMLEPIFAALFAWTLGKEVFSMQQAIGGALIVVAALAASIF